MTTECTHGSKSVHQCDIAGVLHYECEECAPQSGHRTLPWSSSTPQECAYDECAAGTFSSGHNCEACGVNTYSPAAGASSCLNCNTLESGLYQTNVGASACVNCLGHAGDANACTPGHEFVNTFARMQALFNMYAATSEELRLESYYNSFCQAGFACLPCVKGTYEKGRICHNCTLGSYNPNYAATACYACSSGQNTTSTGATNASLCVCTPGFD